MAKYRKKPVIIEAMRWDGDEECYNAICDWAGINFPANLGKDGIVYDLTIPTLEGDHRANHGDMIIKGIKGEFYPCKPDIFDATYELVE